MSQPGSNSAELQGAIRNAWLAVAAICVMFVAIPSVYIFLHGPTSATQFDSTTNLIEIIRIAGSTSAIAFVIIAIRFHAKRSVSKAVSPAWMQRALAYGLVASLVYWLLFFLVLMSSGSDGPILPGGMLLLYPALVVWYVLLVARRT